MKNLTNFKKFLALTVSAIMLAFLPNVNALTASAEEPVTYYLMYSESDEDWRYQLGSAWDSDAESTPSYYLHEKIRNGDIVVIGNGSGKMLTLNVRLSNLTICNTTGELAMVSATGGIDNCYFTNGSLASVTGDVTNAYVYGASVANFNNNVGNLYTYKDDPDAGPTVGVIGTVSYFMAEDTYDSNAPYGTNFAADSFRMENGDLNTDSAKYTRDVSGGAVTSAAQTAAQTPATPAPAPSGSSAASGEYDDVPKTGETAPILWLCLTAAVCFGGSLILKKSAK